MAYSISTLVEERIAFVVLRIVTLFLMAFRHLKKFLNRKKISMESVINVNIRIRQIESLYASYVF